jgi:2-oxoglutarate ferredoxin oxidoreductase subunit gamma
MGMSGEAQVLLGGSGGQGLVLSGVILAQAALGRGFHVSQTQQYGIASRGGFSGAGVIISRQPILYPLVTEPSAVVCLSTEAIDKYCRGLSPGVPVVYDCHLGKTPGTGQGHPLPILQEARARGWPESANIISLGALARYLPVVDLESLAAAVRARFGGQWRESNLLALQVGWELEARHGQE